MNHVFWMRFASLLIGVSPVFSNAIRIPPRPVSPVTENGIRYSAAGNGISGYIVATDTASNKELWRIKLYRVRIDPAVEADAQFIFLTDLKLNGNMLVARDERKRCYALDLATKKHRVQPCGREFSPVLNR